jgi:hypothetical protein
VTTRSEATQAARPLDRNVRWRLGINDEKHRQQRPAKTPESDALNTPVL